MGRFMVNLLFIAFIIFPMSSYGVDAVFQSYHSNIFGVAYNKKDRGYVDVQLSVKYPIFSILEDQGVFYFGGTTKGAFYALHSLPWGGDRHSSPYINLLFNPDLFFHYALDEPNKEENLDSVSYIDVGFSHESNGQSIDSEEAYLAQQDQMVLQGDKAIYAQDYISRSWDSFFIDYHMAIDRNKWDAFFKLKIFGGASDYYPWEGQPKQTTIQDVDGIRIRVQYSTFKENYKVIRAKRNRNRV